MSISLVQHTSGTGSSGSTILLPQAVTSGNTVVASVWAYSSTVPTITVSDNKGNTWTHHAKAKAANGLQVQIYAFNVTGGSSFTLTITLANMTGGTIYGASVEEYSGLTTTDPGDQGAGSNASYAASSSTTVSSPNTSTLTQASELVIGAVWSITNTPTFAAGTGYTLNSSVSGATVYGASEYKVVSSTAAVNSSFTASGLSAGGWNPGIIVGTYKGAAAAAGGPSLLPLLGVGLREVRAEESLAGQLFGRRRGRRREVGDGV